MRLFLIALASAGVLLGQEVPVAVLTPRGVSAAPAAQPARNVNAGVPVMGYTLAQDSMEIYPISGTLKRAQIGPAIELPKGTARVYLPPRQQYMLLETNPSKAIGVWNPRSQSAVLIPGTIPHPDAVWFSARGDAAVLYSAADALLQVVENLPGQASLVRTLSLDSGEPLQVAVSDDGALVAAASNLGSLAISSEGRWQALAGYSPRAFSFVPKTHDLVISDRATNQVMLLRNAGALRDASAVVLAQDIPGDLIAFTKNGEQMISADSKRGALWRIDLSTNAVAPLPSASGTRALSVLRDGYTFLVSSPPPLSFIQLAPAPDLTVAARTPVR